MGETYGGRCVVFEPEDLRQTKELGSELQVADENFEGCRGMIGSETETWMSNEHYAMAIALAELLKLRVLTEIPKKSGLRLRRIGTWTIWTKPIHINKRRPITPADPGIFLTRPDR